MERSERRRFCTYDGCFFGFTSVNTKKVFVDSKCSKLCCVVKNAKICVNEFLIFRDYNDSPAPPSLYRRKETQNQRGSLLQPSESSSDEGKDIDPAHSGQLTLYRGPPRHHFEPFMAAEPIYAYGRVPSGPSPNSNLPFAGMIPTSLPPPPPPPLMQCNGPRFLPAGPYPPMLLADEYLPPPPEAFMPPMAMFGPPMIPPMDFELFTFGEQKKKKNKSRLKKYRSLECLSLPPPLPPPMFYPPPPGYASAGTPSAGLRDAPAPAADGYANFSEYDGYASDDAPASVGFTSAAPFG